MADLDGLLRRTRVGDQDAARQLVEQLYPVVARIVRSHLPRREVAEDWEQEVFLRLFGRLHQYRGEAPLEHWTARVALTTCLDLLRKRRRLEVHWSDLNEREASLLRGSPPLPDDAEGALTARDLVARLLEGLPADDRVVIRLLDLEQRSVAQVAEFLGRGQSWVKVRAFRARRKLAELLKRLLAET